MYGRLDAYAMASDYILWYFSCCRRYFHYFAHPSTTQTNTSRPKIYPGLRAPLSTLVIPSGRVLKDSLMGFPTFAAVPTKQDVDNEVV